MVVTGVIDIPEGTKKLVLVLYTFFTGEEGCTGYLILVKLVWCSHKNSRSRNGLPSLCLAYTIFQVSSSSKHEAFSVVIHLITWCLDFLELAGQETK